MHPRPRPRYRLVLLASALLLGGLAPRLAAQPAGKRPPIIPIRFAEQYTYLATDSSRTQRFDELKYVPLRGESYASFGADARYQYERLVNPAGVARQYHTLRFMLHSDLRLWRDRLRIFGQLASGLLVNDIMPRPIDRDQLFFLNLFAELDLLNRGKTGGGGSGNKPPSLRLRAGRFEMNYGAGRLVTIREGPNVRQYWEGAQLLYRSPGWTIDAFVTEFGLNQAGVFDNPVFGGPERFWGIYANRSLAFWEGNHAWDVYYLGLDETQRQLFSYRGEELRHTLGTRLVLDYPDIRVDAEVMGQFGRAGPLTISAQALAVDIQHPLFSGSRAQSVHRLTAGVKVDYWTGDRDSTDTRLNNFIPPYPRQGYFRGSGQVFPTNFSELSPYLSASPLPGLVVSTGHTWYWRASSEDGIYIGGIGIPVLPPTGGLEARTLGRQFDVSVVWTPGRHFSLSALYSRFWPNGFVEQSPTPREVTHFANIIFGYRI